MQDEEKIIDVGEADYEETEVDLEAQPEPKEEPVAKAGSAEPSSKPGSIDPFRQMVRDLNK